MSRTNGSVIGLLLLSLTGALAPRAGYAVNLALYAALPSTELVALSPDGTRLAYVHTQGDRRIIVIADVADRKMIRWVDASAEIPQGIQWADDDNLLITTSVATTVLGFKEEWSSLRVYNLVRNQLRDLPGEVAGTPVVKTVVGPATVRHIGSDTVVFMTSMSVSTPGLALFRCDLTTGNTSVVRVRPSSGVAAPYVSWMVGRRGRRIAEWDYDTRTERWSIGEFDESTMRQLSSGQAAVEVPELRGFGPKGDALLVQSIEHGQTVWSLLSIEDGKLSQMPKAEVFDSPIFDRSSRLIGGIDIDNGREDVVFLDPQWVSRWTAVVKAFGGDEVKFVTASTDFSKVVVLVEGANYGDRYVLIDLDNNQAFPVGNLYAGIDQPLEVRRITYAAGDGLQIPAYLTLPPNRQLHDLALVVLPHGSSAGRSTGGFDWWAQALAEEGYAVLQPNYRGSDLDESFVEAGFGQWGRKMQTDLSDGVRYLVQQGIADPSKVCIVGKGYGGYAALAGVTLQPTVYRCAVSVDGMSDLAGILKWDVRGGLDAFWVERYWERWWGVSGGTDPRLAAISPIEHVDSVRAPVLLIHSVNDSTIPYEQSQVMYDALRRDKKEVELVTLRKGDHELSHSETRLKVLEAAVAFLQAHDPPN